MQTIKIHLEVDEMGPVQRLADELKVSVEDIAYAGLDRIMNAQKSEEIRQEILRLKSGRRGSLPKWADQPREIHAYESMT